MIWVLVWTVLLLAAAALLCLLCLRLWRQSRSLVSELGAATDRVAEVADRLAELESVRDSSVDRPTA